MATAYTTEAEANVYFAEVGEPAAWATATATERTLALMNGANWLDRTYGARWVGDKIDRAQDRDWPRDNATDANGFAIANTGTPKEVKNAANEAAARYLIDSSMTDGDVSSRGISRERVKADIVEEDISYIGSKPDQQKTFPLIAGMLWPVLRAGTGAGVGVVSLG
jgi:hypothetical protein